MTFQIAGIQIFHIGQTVIAAYGLYYSYISIVNLRQYEDSSKKLAAWSNEAARQLHKTRTTQASGAVSILVSFIAAAALALQGPASPWYMKSFANPAMMVVIFFARGHIKGYWAPSDGKTVGLKVPMPGMEQYNEAQRKTQKLLQALEYLEYSWVLTSVAAALVGYK